MKKFIIAAVTLLLIGCGGFSKEDCYNTVRDRYPTASIYTRYYGGSNMFFIVVTDSTNAPRCVSTDSFFSAKITNDVPCFEQK